MVSAGAADSAPSDMPSAPSIRRVRSISMADFAPMAGKGPSLRHMMIGIGLLVHKSFNARQQWEKYSMNIFLAGASGAIGRQLVPLLVEAGHAVTGTTRSAERAEELK